MSDIDETCLYKSRYINLQNTRIWSTKNSLHPEKNGLRQRQIIIDDFQDNTLAKKNIVGHYILHFFLIGTLTA